MCNDESDTQSQIPAASTPPAAPATLSDEALKEKHVSEYQRSQFVQQRWNTLQDRYPTLLSRLAILQTLVALQKESGGAFAEKTVFIHMADHVLSIHRIGEINMDTLTTAIEVYENDDIVPGIIFVPIDQILWAGTTNNPFGIERMGLLPHTEHPTARFEAYEKLRRTLAGLPPLG